MTRQMSGGRLIRRRDYVEMPWRNGAGVTFEIAREPIAGNEPLAGNKFDWRLSLAVIARSGPFSNFAGYQRAIILVSGAGCVLSGLEEQAVALDAPGASRIFSGAAPVTSDLVNGPCCDLNLMVREPGTILRIRHMSAIEGQGQLLEADRHNAVFCLSGALECFDGAGEQRITLSLHDTLIVSPEQATAWRVRSGHQAAAAVICTWENRS